MLCHALLTRLMSASVCLLLNMLFESASELSRDASSTSEPVGGADACWLGPDMLLPLLDRVHIWDTAFRSGGGNTVW